MKKFYAWKHPRHTTEPEIDTPVWVSAKDIDSAHALSERHFKFNFYFSEFHVSVTSEDGKEAYMCTGPKDQTPEERMSIQAALDYWGNLSNKMKETIHNHYKNNNDDWRSKSKEELQAIVKCLKPIPVPPDSCFDTPVKED